MMLRLMTVATTNLHQKTRTYNFEKKQLVSRLEFSFTPFAQSKCRTGSISRASPSAASPPLNYRQLPGQTLLCRRSSTLKYSQHAFLLLQSSCLGRCNARHGYVPDTERRYSKGASAKDSRANAAEMKDTTATIIGLEACQATDDIISSCS
jgi:hypothetical protein